MSYWWVLCRVSLLVLGSISSLISWLWEQEAVYKVNMDGLLWMQRREQHYLRRARVRRDARTSIVRA